MAKVMTSANGNGPDTDIANAIDEVKVNDSDVELANRVPKMPYNSLQRSLKYLYRFRRS
jgi:hypothetical protein